MPKQKNMRILFLIGCLTVIFPAIGMSSGKVEIRDVELTKLAPDRYKMTAEVYNRTREPREVVLRAQITFYDRTAPAGDKPVQLIRKDFIQVLRPWESRSLNIRLIDEGTVPTIAVRVEPMLRVRREREWLY